ncbi:hypothetical protein CA54_01700 [Symmachiella macrocystis]|uniref:Uncharacterized protein n=1 Tax=Symmachiella macrocystis TaxID=2527985 RepID=A0A5C6BGS2_9PLAN|nr:hypothetical protein [Symmachiella macrocystis]TWU11363.1 hypothetical protein CA54_01700 [Symmachiella macrocystis]
MDSEPITHFDQDPQRLAVIGECIENYDVGKPGAKWPNNIISRTTVVYGSGVIADRDDPVVHDVDPAEWELCKRIAAEANASISGADVGMGSEASDPFNEFYITANRGESVPSLITEEFIREKFRGTLFPPVTITVEPLVEQGVWWSEVMADANGYVGEELESYLAPWRSMMSYLRDSPHLSGASFVRIGDLEALQDLDTKSYPDGTEINGCVLPRLAVGLTNQGSIAGIFGYSVQT